MPADTGAVAARAPKRRGRRPAAARAGLVAPDADLAGRAGQAAGPTWLYHHLAVSGPAADVADFAAAARGPGIIPWWLDAAAIEEDVFNLAASQPPHRRHLTMAGCRILARQFRERIEARHDRATALVGHSHACPLDLHTLLPVPGAVLRLGERDRAARAWRAEHWGTERLWRVVERPQASPGRRLPAGHAVVGYGFSTGGETPTAAVERLRPRWPALRFALTPRLSD